jgi:hypothetical protein
MPTHLDLLTARNAARDLLDKRWDWLSANPDHPKFREREDACLDALNAYERAEDAITDADAPRDVVVTVPKRLWDEWLAEGDLPGDSETGQQYGFDLYGPRPNILPGARVYIVAHGKLRGYAPLVRMHTEGNGFALVRAGGAVACTIDEPITGFRGWRYRWWRYEDEIPFPDWRLTEDAIANQPTTQTTFDAATRADRYTS